ncbi:hypothetical protein D3C83_84810 [compost metagenome]
MPMHVLVTGFSPSSEKTSPSRSICRRVSWRCVESASLSSSSLAASMSFGSASVICVSALWMSPSCSRNNSLNVDMCPPPFGMFSIVPCHASSLG